MNTTTTDTFDALAIVDYKSEVFKTAVQADLHAALDQRASIDKADRLNLAHIVWSYYHYSKAWADVDADGNIATPQYETNHTVAVMLDMMGLSSSKAADNYAGHGVMRALRATAQVFALMISKPTIGIQVSRERHGARVEYRLTAPNKLINPFIHQKVNGKSVKHANQDETPIELTVHSVGKLYTELTPSGRRNGSNHKIGDTKSAKEIAEKVSLPVLMQAAKLAVVQDGGTVKPEVFKLVDEEDPKVDIGLLSDCLAVALGRDSEEERERVLSDQIRKQSDQIAKLKSATHSADIAVMLQKRDIEIAATIEAAIKFIAMGRNEAKAKEYVEAFEQLRVELILDKQEEAGLGDSEETGDNELADNEQAEVKSVNG